MFGLRAQDLHDPCRVYSPNALPWRVARADMTNRGNHCRIDLSEELVR
jgi:hypothetical protein